MREFPESYLGHEQTPHTVGAYCYAFTHPDGEKVCWTNFDRPLTLENLPGHLGLDDPQTFDPMQVKHAAVTQSDRFDSRGTTLTVASTDSRLRAYFLTTPAVKLTCHVIRIAGMAIPEGGTLDYATAGWIIESGVLSDFTFDSQHIGATITPEPMYIDRAIPRAYFERQCNWPLYGAGCGLNRDDWKFETTILAINRAQREVTCDGLRDGAAADFYSAGHLAHGPTGQRLTVATSWQDAGNTVLKLWHWHHGLTVADAVTLFAGCRHTTDDCKTKFGNQANFGGFPRVPNKNPAVNGV